MVSGIARSYWDACVFLDFISGHPTHAPDIEAILETADQGKIEILTSTVTIAEVAFVQHEKANNVLSPEIEARIEKLWIPPSPITLVEFHAGIAHAARQLMRRAIEHGSSGLKPFDAIHFATAEMLGVSEFNTYETRLARYSSLVGFTIRAPYVMQIPMI